MLGRKEYAHFISDDEIMATNGSDKFFLPRGVSSGEDDCPCLYCDIELPTEEEIVEHMAQCPENPSMAQVTNFTMGGGVPPTKCYTLKYIIFLIVTSV